MYLNVPTAVYLLRDWRGGGDVFILLVCIVCGYEYVGRNCRMEEQTVMSVNFEKIISKLTFI